MSDADLADLLALATRLAAEAASLVGEGLRHAREDVSTKTTLTDMVTATDRASEQLIVDGLRAARPGDAIVGEEGTTDTGTTGVRWLVDPVDGTTNFLYGLPAFAVSIAAEIDGEVAVGVVADVPHHELFTATLGGGAHLDGRPLRCAAGGELATALVGTGFGYDAARRARQGAVAAGVLPLVRDLRRVGAASIDLCWVACGRLDAYYERGLQPWDLAAGALVAAEAGAVVGDLDGGRPSGEFVLAARSGLFEPLRGVLSGFGAAQA
jgi:myo-inositol-1(or 4)-monophosphatase